MLWPRTGEPEVATVRFIFTHPLVWSVSDDSLFAQQGHRLLLHRLFRLAERGAIPLVQKELLLERSKGHRTSMKEREVESEQAKRRKKRKVQENEEAPSLFFFHASEEQPTRFFFIFFLLPAYLVGKKKNTKGGKKKKERTHITRTTCFIRVRCSHM